MLVATSHDVPSDVVFIGTFVWFLSQFMLFSRGARHKAYDGASVLSLTFWHSSVLASRFLWLFIE